MPHSHDLDLTPKDISNLSSADAVAGFFTKLGYPTGVRKELTASSLELTGDTAQAVRAVELLAADEDDFFRVVFAHVRSITAKVRNDLARKLGRTGSDHLVVLASNFDVLEFVLLDKRTRRTKGPAPTGGVQIIPRTVSVNRKTNGTLDRRILRRLTWTGTDGLDQFEKLRSVFESAVFTSHYFQNRALFSDHFLRDRLPEDAAWGDNPREPFNRTKDLLHDARKRWTGKAEQALRDELFEPIWKVLGFKAKVNKRADQDRLEPDYILNGSGRQSQASAFVYRWDRWLDGPDYNDPDTPEENPGAAVVSALANGNGDWVIVTNGKLWRLYSREAHSRSTNFYEVDVEEALAASDETDPNEAFRYWWLFFRHDAFKPVGDDEEKRCWLDTIVQGSRDYAKRLGERLKDRVFTEIFPHLAKGFLEYRRKQVGRRRPTEEELSDTFEATLTLLYRLLFLLYAEARDLLPIGESPYEAASLKRIKEEIAEHASTAVDAVPDRLSKAYNKSGTDLYDRLTRLFEVMDRGDSSLNVPCYNGGLFITEAEEKDSREHRIARFLAKNKVPDYFLALAIDRLARDEDEKPIPGATDKGAKLPHGLVFIDYKSLEVRHLGSIYEGLLEFKLKVATEDLATRTEKKKEKFIPLSQAKPGRGKKTADVAVPKGHVYLSNDKAERKATGSYYTPDPIVEYIVEHTVGPVLREKLDALRGDLKKAGRTFHRHMDNARNNPALLPQGTEPRTFAGEKTYAQHKDLVNGIFDFKVLDPAMGSGHFLVEAVDYITDAVLDFLNRFPHNPVNFALDRTRENILRSLGEQGVTVDANKLTDVNLLKRHVLKRCIYGVDLNPMAVELAKVSLWLDAFTLGAPLSFLDHHLRCGNSLIGATFKDLEQATEGQLFAVNYEPLLRAIRHVLFVNAMADATAAEVHQSTEEYAQARRELSGYQIVLDLLVADHFIDNEFKPSKLLQEAHDLDLTTRDTLLASFDQRDFLLVDRVETVAHHPDLRFFHWETEFPEVFFCFADAEQRQLKHKNDIAVGSAGFDAVIGNPPWERIKLQEREFFDGPAPEIARATNAATRRKLIAKLSQTNPELHQRYCDQQAAAESLSSYLRQGGHYPRTARGDINTYTVFTERGHSLLCAHGHSGLLIPSGIASDNTTREFFGDLVASEQLVALYDFENRQGLFPDVHRSFKFSIFIVGGSEAGVREADFVFFAHSAEDLNDEERHIHLSHDDMALMNPNTRTCPIFRSDPITGETARRNADLCKGIYQRVPVLIDESKGEAGNPWGISFLRMFDQTNDAEHFIAADSLSKRGYTLDGNCWVRKSKVFLPLYEAKMVQMYDHRAASVIVSERNWMRQGQTEATTQQQHSAPDFVAMPRFWVDEAEVERRLEGLGARPQGFIGFKDITSPTNERTMIAGFVPYVGATNKLVLMPSSHDAFTELCLLANLNALIHDWACRQKIGGITLNFFIVKQLPVFPPNFYEQSCPWADESLHDWIATRALELSYTATDLKPLAEACGKRRGPYRWEDARRAELRAELDAAYLHLYGVTRSDAEYVVNHFHSTHRKDREEYGEELTRRLTLKVYDQLARVISG